jgi:hypothetical protein
MRSIFVRVIGLFLQVILITLAVYVAERLVAHLFNATTRRSKRLPRVGMLFCLRGLPIPAQPRR